MAEDRSFPQLAQEPPSDVLRLGLWKVTLSLAEKGRNFKGHLGDQSAETWMPLSKKVQQCLIRTVYLKSNPWILIYFDPRYQWQNGAVVCTFGGTSVSIQTVGEIR